MGHGSVDRTMAALTATAATARLIGTARAAVRATTTDHGDRGRPTGGSTRAATSDRRRPVGRRSR